MVVYRPVSSQRRAQMEALDTRGEISLDDFVQIRRQLCGTALPLESLRLLSQASPPLAARLKERILPSIVRHARDLIRAGEPALPLHEAGQPARTGIPRAEVAGWIAHMFLGMLPPPTPDHPHLDFAPLLSTARPAEVAKLRCVLTYFDRIAEAAPPGQMEVERLVAVPRRAAQWAADPSPLLPLDVALQGLGGPKWRQGPCAGQHTLLRSLWVELQTPAVEQDCHPEVVKISVAARSLLE